MGDETPNEPLANTDVAAVERLKDAFDRLKAEMGKVIVGQHAVLEELLVAIFARGHCLLIGVPGPGQDPDDPHPGRRAEPELQPDPVHARPDAVGHHRHRGDPGGQGDRRPPVQVPPRARSSRTSSWPTRSTGRRPRPRPPCSKRCRSGR